MNKPTDAQIAEAAFYLWLDEGQPSGRSDEHWHRARAALESAPPAKKRATAKPRAKAAKPGAATARAKPAAAKPRVTKPRKPKA
jgi:hypothetical protein